MPRATFRCSICSAEKHEGQAVHGEMVHGRLLELIQKRHPEWLASERICSECLSHFRADYVEDVLKDERGEISRLEAQVVESLKQQDLLAENINEAFSEARTLGDRLSDGMATLGGSWKFILGFLSALAIWIAFNSAALAAKPFDPYPFILLNLVLSCVAALQAPVIMMSQRRQESKDRLRAENDYKVNLKAELEIRHLHSKLDQLLTRQWQRLLEIQRIQIEMMEDMARRGGKPPEA